MTEEQEKKQQPAVAAVFSQKSPAQLKWDEQRGEEICYIAEWLRKGVTSPKYVYELVYRVDVLQKDDPMLLVKGIDGGEPKVAFVYSPGLLTGLSNMAGLFRAGKLKWREDTYPSSKVLKALAMINES